MKGRRLLALPVLAFVLSCGDDQRPPTGPSAPTKTSEIIRDGAHGGNKDFFWLPPLVPLPLGNPDFELGKFNNTLRPSLRIDICELKPEGPDGTSLPTETTGCKTLPNSTVEAPPIKTFAPGSVNLVNLPRNQWGWWSLFNLPPDGFYYVLWNTRQSNLSVNKYYRIKVFIDGSTVPLGVADVDPMSSLRQWKYSNTGEVIQMVDDVLLPIPFRVEQGALCEGNDLCTSVTVTGDNPNGDEYIIQVKGEDGVPLAGILLPDGWLPPGGPQSVVFTITRVNTGVNNVAAGTQQFPCHGNLPLQQFDACFNYSTIPELPVIDEETGRQFSEAVEVIAAVCFVLLDTEDPREPWVQLWSSEPGVEGDQPKPLRSANAGAILTNPDGADCETQTIGYNGSNPMLQLASAGWQKLKGGAGRLFGVKTAYAFDAGIGGIIIDISNIGPALTAEVRPASSTTPVTVTPGTSVTSSVRVVGTTIHDDEPLGEEVTTTGKTRGIPGLPVTFTLWANGGTTQVPFTALGSPMTLTVITDGAGLATVPWTPPSISGTYSLKVAAQAKGDPIAYSATVSEPLANPTLAFTGTTVTQLASSGTFYHHHLRVTNYTVYPAAMFSALPETEGACAEEENPKRTRVEVYSVAIEEVGNGTLVRTYCELAGPASLQSLSYTRHESITAPHRLYVKLVDRATGLTYVSDRVSLVLPEIIDFETYPDGSAACDGGFACSVTNEFATRGVTFSFVPVVSDGAGSASLYRTSNNPGDEGPSYGVSPRHIPSGGWWNGSVTMHFASNPGTVQFRLQGNDVASNPFSVTAVDGLGNTITVNSTGSETYSVGALTFRRETRSVTSFYGIASVTVNSPSAILFIDNLRIIQLQTD
jgi:hypothetical protein